MPKLKQPEAYRAVLRSREDIVSFFESRARYVSYHGYSPCAWNVKAYGVDLSAEHLFEVHKLRGEYAPSESDTENHAAALAAYEEIQDKLFEYAIVDAQRGVHDCDCYRTLWSGPTLDVKYEFAGRSGGWLVISAYYGEPIPTTEDGLVDWWSGLPFNRLRDLYKLSVQNDADFRRANIVQIVEEAAAWYWLVNYCDFEDEPAKPPERTTGTRLLVPKPRRFIFLPDCDLEDKTSKES